VKTLEGIHDTLEESLKPYGKKLLRVPTKEDREKLLQIPIRRISQFDIEKNKDEIALLEETLQAIEKHLKNVKKYAIDHLKKLIVKYGSEYGRKTRFKAIEEIDRRAIETKEIKVRFDLETGFVGTKVQSTADFVCTNFDKLLVFTKDGTYKATNIAEKQYFEQLLWAGPADKKTIVTVVYKHGKTGHPWGKRFVVDKFILDKLYRYMDEGAELLLFTTEANGTIDLQLQGLARKKPVSTVVSLNDIDVTGAQTKGVRLATEKVKKAVLVPGKKTKN
jgi:topoisomerase-4 subunit A